MATPSISSTPPDNTSAGSMYGSLGLFWNEVFKDKPTLLGLLNWKSLEIAQNYTNIAKSVDDQSGVEIASRTTTNYLPIVIRRSTVMSAKALTSDRYTVGTTDVGESDGFRVAVDHSLQFNWVSDRILNPTTLLTAGNGCSLFEGWLYFDVDPFITFGSSAYTVLDSNGEPLIVSTPEGNITEVELLLWTKNYATTNQNLLTFTEMMTGLHLEEVKHPDVLADTLHHLIKFYGQPTTAQLTAILEGLGLTVTLEDNIKTPNWWVRQGSTDEPAYPIYLDSHMYAGGSIGGLILYPEYRVATYDSAGKLTLPVEGHPVDVQNFTDYINQTANKTKLLTALNLTGPGARLINMVDFVFTHLLQHNTMRITLNITEDTDIELFNAFFPVIQRALPIYTYFIWLVKLPAIAESTYINSVNNDKVPSFTEPLPPMLEAYMINQDVVDLQVVHDYAGDIPASVPHLKIISRGLSLPS